MVQYIKQGDIFGRIGSGLGKGLAEQIPKEIERNRLSQGLKSLGEQQGLSPFQQFSALAGIPGITPQMIQSGGELLRQQAYLDALRNQYDQQNQKRMQYQPTQEEMAQPVKGEIPTLATEKSTAESYKNYIPPTEQEERSDAYENFQKNPARYGFDFEKALQERKAVTQRNQEIQAAYKGQEETAITKENKIKTAFEKEINKLGANSLPARTIQRYEQKIINALLSKKEGGEGLTQEEATKKYSGEIEELDRTFKNLNTLSPWSPRDFNRRLNTISNNLKKSGDQRELMDMLISRYNISPTYAAHRAYKIEKNEMPLLNSLGMKLGTKALGGISTVPLNNAIYEKLKNQMGKKQSPLSVAYELEEKGYNAGGWLDYLNNNREHLEGWQIEQLDKPLSIMNLQDLWLKIWE